MPTTTATPPRFDWSVGHYEHTAAQLLPAAELVIERAAPQAGERLVDVGCGTGNAALLAAARGAQVTGVDPALRLLDVARAQAAEQGIDAEFLPGAAESLPLADASADVVVSVFGLVFASDPAAAAAELARVTRPSGRILFSAWLPEGAVSQVNRLAQEAVMSVLGAPPGPPPFAWHDRAAIERLLGRHGFALTIAEHDLAFAAASPQEYLKAEWETHPLAVAGRKILERQPGAIDHLQARMLSALEEANESDSAFRVTSRYVVVSARRG